MQHPRRDRERSLPSPVPEALADLIAERLQVLGQPTRIRIVGELQCGERNVQELSDAIGATQQNVSKHLKRLYDIGLLTRRPCGREAFYALAQPGAVALLATAATQLGPDDPLDQQDDARDV